MNGTFKGRSVECMVRYPDLYAHENSSATKYIYPSNRQRLCGEEVRSSKTLEFVYPDSVAPDVLFLRYFRKGKSMYSVYPLKISCCDCFTLVVSLYYPNVS